MTANEWFDDNLWYDNYLILSESTVATEEME